MLISKPYIIQEKNEIKLITEFTIKGKSDYLWFSFDAFISDYLVIENVDASLVALLLLAMKEGEDIELNAPVSAKLYYQLKHYIIPALSLANHEWHKIEIKPFCLNSNGFHPKSISGTGISGGVDSFSVIVDHLSEFEEFKINYYTFFNAGSHGDLGGDETREVFRTRLKLVEPYAKENNMPLIVIDTNLSEILKMHHQQTHTLRSIACVLNLQKLFKYYYYGATHRFDYFKINDIDMAYYETLLLNMLSTESTTFYSAVSQMTRVERTEIISDYEPSYKYLNVCIDPIKANKGENCSVCSKCLRTELTLDILQKIENYNKVFDLSKYDRIKIKFIGEVIAERKNNLYYNDIIHLMKKTRYKVKAKSYWYSILYILNRETIVKIKKVKFVQHLFYKFKS